MKSATIFFWLVWCSASSAEDSNYRLPGTVVPSKYVVDLTVPESVFTEQTRSFQGTSRVTFRVTSKTDVIQIHHRVDVGNVFLERNKQELIITQKNYDDITEILSLNVLSPLVEDIDYTLQFEFNGTLETQQMHGFYLSSYQNENNVSEYLVTTQFQPTHARNGFPCFDEPQYKATFSISLTYPSYLTALGNTSPLNVSLNENYTTTTFEETPKMSTYLVAFMISSFTCTEGASIAQGVPHRVCSRPEEEINREWAVEIGPPLMQALENLTGIKYGSQMSKMDQVALPDFSAGAMENWGLVTYRETGLLWNEKESSDSYKKSIAQVIAHEFTHMWFGDLVTCQWWNYTFLNEGFARYYQYFAAAKVNQLSSWELDRQFNIEQLHTALLADSTLSSQALTSPASSPTEISAKFGTISYNKGASIYRMIETNIMGHDNFIEGIQNYLSTFSSEATVPENLWTSLEPYVPDHALPTNLNLSTVLHNWIELAGHPVVSVKKNGNDVILSQKRFLMSKNESDIEYFVPITYTTSNNIDSFTNTTVNQWLVPGKNLTLLGALSGADWIVLNNRQSGYYRVNYDKSLWASLRSVLYKDHRKIDVLNRAQIVSDVYNFARAKSNGADIDVGYKEVFDLLRYLENETDYYPWYAAIVGNNHLLQRIGYDSDEGRTFVSFMTKLMQNVYQTVPFDKLDSTNHIYSLKQIVILSKLCRYEEKTCVEKARELFGNFKQRGQKIPGNLRSVVYCTALRHSDDPKGDFEFLWKKSQETKLMTEILTIYGSLACTEDTASLKWLLKQSLNDTSGIRFQDFASVWSYVYTSSKVGAVAAVESIKNNYEELCSYYSNIDSLITNIAGYIYSEDQLQALKDLLKHPSLTESHKKTIEQTLETATSNIEWGETLKNDVKAFFDSDSSGNNSVAIKPSITLSLALFLLFKILF